MRRVYKWPLDVVTQVPWSPDDRVLMVAEQHGGSGLPTLWAEQEDEQPAPTREFVVVGTGHEAPVGLEHVGSAVCAGGSLVWHVYAWPVERPF
jgi:hypothetical protein